MRKADKFESKLETWKTLTSLVRFFGSMIISFDLTLKIYYYVKSRFANRFVKELYFGFLVQRPIIIFFVVAYNFCCEARKLGDFNSKSDNYIELQEIRKSRRN